MGEGVRPNEDSHRVAFDSVINKHVYSQNIVEENDHEVVDQYGAQGIRGAVNTDYGSSRFTQSTLNQSSSLSR